MSGQAGSLEQIALFLGELLQPLQKSLGQGSADVLFAKLGFVPPAGFLGQGGPAAAISASVSAVTDLIPAIANLRVAITADDSGAISLQGVESISKIASLLRGLSSMGSSVTAAAQADPSLSAAQKLRIQNFGADLPKLLLGSLLVDYLLANAPNFGASLATIGLLDIQPDTGVAGDPLFPPNIRPMLRLDRLGSLLSQPLDYLKATFGFGLPGFDGVNLFERLQVIFDTRFERTTLYAPAGQPAVLEAQEFRLAVDTGVSPPCIAYPLRFGLSEPVSVQIPLGGPWMLGLQLSGQFAAGSTVQILTSGEIGVVPPSGTAAMNFSLSLTADSTGHPYTLLGQTGATRLTIDKFGVSIGVAANWDPSRGKATAQPTFGLSLGNLKAILNAAGGDAFIGMLIGDGSRETSISLAPVWSPNAGLRFNGSSTIEIAIPTHVVAGPVSIETVYISGQFKAGSIPVELSVSARGSLGPLEAVADRIGVTLELSFPDRGGNLGPLQLDLRFKPPNGVGLSLDAGVIIGGGYLYIDSEHGEYAGALELVFAGFLGLHAVGLISTKLPDGSPGFSLLIIVTADFGPGIQLGFGFTLLAVGGLLGLNRAMLFQPLLDGIRTGAIESIMFPQNVVANALRIISDLRAIFPPQQGTFLIGPMAKLGWGEPTLISLSLGVIIEIPPGDIAILGILKLALPAAALPVLVIQVNFAGALEFDKQRFYFFAALFDSHVLFITIEGEMGVLMAFGDDANFVVSVGGFHPQFIPPPLPFPSPRRIEVDIINESFARIRCDGYFAVTSNSCQFGSHSEFFFGFSALSVEGHSGFDALLQFSPFHFSVAISTSFCVKVFGLGVYGIGIDLTLDGPTQWHANGTASLSFFFFSVDIGISFTWGDSRDTTLPPVALMPVLTGELGKQSNWRAVLPAGSNLLVSLRKLDAAEAVQVLHPVGTLQVSQRAIPLDLTLDKAGNQAPNDANRFALTVKSAGLSAVRTLQEQFAPAQFKNLSDAQKLSQPAYSPMDGGIELSAKGTAYASGTAITCNVRYDLTIIDTKLRRFSRKYYVFLGSLFIHFLSGSSVARNSLSAFSKAQTQPFPQKVAVNPESFAVALTANNQVYHPEAATFTSQALANDYVARAVANDPTLAGSIHVIPQFEVAA